jgi:hypothetical protein
MVKFLFGILDIASIEVALQAVGIRCAAKHRVLNRRRASTLDDFVGVVEHRNAFFIDVKALAVFVLDNILLARASSTLFAHQSIPKGVGDGVTVITLTHKATSRLRVIAHAERRVRDSTRTTSFDFSVRIEADVASTSEAID